MLMSIKLYFVNFLDLCVDKNSRKYGKGILVGE